MILPDTSVWADHFRAPDEDLAELLDAGNVLMHPFIIGEIALGYLKRRRLVLGSLRLLTSVNVATDDEVLTFIERNGLFGTGIGYIDAHLLAATRMTPEVSLWTRDKTLARIAGKLGLAA